MDAQYSRIDIAHNGTICLTIWTFIRQNFMFTCIKSHPIFKCKFTSGWKIDFCLLILRMFDLYIDWTILEQVCLQYTKQRVLQDLLHTWWLCRLKQVSQAEISYCIPRKTVGCNYSSLPEIPASGDKIPFVTKAMDEVYSTEYYGCNYLCVPQSHSPVLVHGSLESVISVSVCVCRHLINGSHTTVDHGRH